MRGKTQRDSPVLVLLAPIEQSAYVIEQSSVPFVRPHM